MSCMKVIGISRGHKFSPNHVSNDSVIYNMVVAELQHKGIEVESHTEEDFVSSNTEARVYFGMARSKAALDKLKELEDQGAIVINSAYGIENCIRTPMTRLLTSHGIPHPHSLVIRTDEPLPLLQYPCWLKRGDSHAIIKADVAYALNQSAAEIILDDFRSRQIPEVVVNTHLEGDIIKFYGVMNSNFFHWFYPDPTTHSKFGLEQINGKAKKFKFNETQLKHIADDAASIMRVPIYGGDCIISSKGEISLIDFNDWPSFAPCRQEASKHIAEYIYGQAANLFKE